MKNKFSGSKKDCLLSSSQCDFGFEAKDINKIKPIGDRIIGQERAVESIQFGLRMKKPGHNIFV